jgi:stearoyl-CoA desaturase (delta-9 desaturase)
MSLEQDASTLPSAKENHVTTLSTPTPIRAKRDYGTAIGLGFIHLCALAAFVPAFFSWSGLAVCLVLVYVTGGLGITLGYHRLLTHRSFRMPRALEYLTAFFGTLALQGGPIWWVATHRKHHAHADKDGDPHDVYKGWWWAHADWLYRDNKDRPARNEVARYTKDMIDDKVYVFLNTFEVPIQIALGLVLFAHTNGYRTFKTTDRSMNNWMVALLAFGEGWHNNHHAFPFSARHGMKRSEFDMTWATIKMLAALRLAESVRVPTSEMMDRLRIDRELEAQELTA